VLNNVIYFLFLLYFLRFYLSPCIVCMFMGHVLIDLSNGSKYVDL